MPLPLSPLYRPPLHTAVLSAASCMPENEVYPFVACPITNIIKNNHAVLYCHSSEFKLVLTTAICINFCARNFCVTILSFTLIAYHIIFCCKIICTRDEIFGNKNSLISSVLPKQTLRHDGREKLEWSHWLHQSYYTPPIPTSKESLY